MNFKVLQSLLEDAEDAAKNGLEKQKQREKDAADKKREAQRDVKSSHAEAERKADAALKAEDDLKKKAAKEAEQAAKTASAEHKVKSAKSIADLKGDVDEFIANFFDNFPLHGGDTADAAAVKYPTREAALEAFKAYKKVSERLQVMLDSMNSSLKNQNKVSATQLDKYKRQATAVAKSGNVPRALTNFVRKEAKFFKRLITVTDDYRLNEEDFKELLALKIRQTDPSRVPDAAQALNMLFSFAVNSFRSHARTIATIGKTHDSEEGAGLKKAREAASAVAVAQDVADEKDSGF